MLDFRDCADDDDAFIEAPKLLKLHGSAVAVEIWQDDRLVIRVDRDPPELAASIITSVPNRPCEETELRPAGRAPSGSPR